MTEHEALNNEKQSDLFSMSPEFRERVVKALGKLLESEIPAEVLKAAEIILQLDQLNVQAAEDTRLKSWIGKPSNN